MYCDWPTLERCCFCMPLRRGVLIFAYINIIFSGFMVGVYSYSFHTELGMFPIYHGTGMALPIPEGVCIAIYCLEIIFTAVLLYGAHKKLIEYIRIYYYFALTTTLVAVLMQILDVSGRLAIYVIFEVMPVMLGDLCIHVYLIILVRSLLKSMERSGTHAYENQLQNVVYEGNMEGRRGVYDPTVVPAHQV